MQQKNRTAGMILPSGFFIVVGQDTLSCSGGKQASKGRKFPLFEGKARGGMFAYLPGLLNP